MRDAVLSHAGSFRFECVRRDGVKMLAVEQIFPTSLLYPVANHRTGRAVVCACIGNLYSYFLLCDDRRELLADALGIGQVFEIERLDFAGYSTDRMAVSIGLGKISAENRK